jgi:RNA polymerase sigma-70 factor (ECF subfamily)
VTPVADPGQEQDQTSDEAPLVAAASRGDTVAFNRLVLRYQDVVYTLCFRLTGNPDDAADAAQEAFISSYRHIGSFRGGVFRSWLLRIAANCCYDLHRWRKRRPADSLDSNPDDDEAATDPEDAGPGPEALALQRELADVVQAGLLQLPADQRLAVVLCDLYGFDYQAIASTTRVELGTVKSRINRGRRRLRDHLLANRELLPPAYRLTEEQAEMRERPAGAGDLSPSAPSGSSGAASGTASALPDRSNGPDLSDRRARPTT